MEKFLPKAKTVFHTLKKIIYDCWKTLIRLCKSETISSVPSVQLVNTANIICSQIQLELYDILTQTHHPFIQVLSSPYDIHNGRWHEINNQIIYSYEIYLSQIPTRSMLIQFHKTLVHDIAVFQATLPCSTPFDFWLSCSNYPCIMSGMLINYIGVKGNMMRFEILTNWTP